MALPGHLKTLLAGAHRLPLRFLSFSTPEEATEARRRRMTGLGMPLTFLRQTSPPPPNPNTPKLPEPVSALSGKRLELHNKILKLIYEKDLYEAALFTKHSVYSNCPPTIFTVDAVMAAQLRHSKYNDLLALHRFVIQAGIAPNVVTYNLVFQAYLDCGRVDTALEYYKQMINAAPFSPSPSTYRVLIKGLVNNGMVDRALELRGEMVELKGFSPDPLVYHYLMMGLARNKDADGIFELFEEFKEKAGVVGDGVVEDGHVYGGLMNGYFMKGMEKEAMECYEIAVRENSKVRMSDVAYTSVLDALAKYGKFDEVLKLFDRMLGEHNYPTKLSVNLESFNVMVDWYCGRGSFKDAIEVFRKMESYRCVPDVRSFNNLISQLCANSLLVEAEEVYGEMDGRGARPNEDTFGMLMDACLKEGRTDDGAAYFKKMVDLQLPCNLAVYSRLVGHLVKVGKLDDARSFYDLMVKKLKMDNACYKFMMGALSDAGRLDEMLKMVDEMLDYETIGLDEELQEFVKGELRKEGREEDLVKLIEERERQKAEAKAREIEEIEAAKRSTRAAFASIFQMTNLGSIEDVSSSTDVVAEDNGSLESAQHFGQERRCT